MKIIKPPKLQKGDTIGVVATSYPFPTDNASDYYKQYEKGVAKLRSLGFKTKEAENLKGRKWWFAGSPKKRAEDINSMFADSDVKAIIVHDGGHSAIAILEHLDYELIKSNPKPFIGFSDVTNIHSALFSKLGLVGFHGPLLTYGLGKMWDKHLPNKVEEGKKQLLEILTSTKLLGKLTPLTEWECWREGKVQGQLFGGNLSVLCSLIGTEYFPSKKQLEGSIFFWEIDNVPSHRIEKGLYQLKYAGVLGVISGMLVGKLPGIKRSGGDALEEPKPKELVLNLLEDYNFPIIAEVDFGHETVDIPIPIGLEAKIKADSLKIEILESAVV